jgi:hypothetical protein
MRLLMFETGMSSFLSTTMNLSQLVLLPYFLTTLQVDYLNISFLFAYSIFPINNNTSKIVQASCLIYSAVSTNLTTGGLSIALSSSASS